MTEQQTPVAPEDRAGQALAGAILGRHRQLLFAHRGLLGDSSLVFAGFCVASMSRACTSHS